MDPPNNQLLAALGAYASDEDASIKSESVEGTPAPDHTNSKDIYIGKSDNAENEDSEDNENKLKAISEQTVDREEVTDNEEEDKEAQDVDTLESDSDGSDIDTEYGRVSRRELDRYQTTKKELNRLLGCDRVKDPPTIPETSEYSESLQTKFRQWHDLKAQGASFNETLLNNKTFRNPTVYKRLVDHLDLEETGTNFPPNTLLPEKLRNDFSALKLAEEQERRARESAARHAASSSNGTRSVEFRSVGHQTQSNTTAGGIISQRTLQNESSLHQHTYSRTNTSHSTQYISNDSSVVKTSQNPQNFKDALERAKLIAQHLSAAKKQ